MVAARYFDGRQSLARDVRLSISHGRVTATGGDVARDEPLAAVSISERIGRTPRFVRFSDGAYCEVTDQRAFDAVLAAAHVSQGRLTRWEQSAWLAAVLLVTLVVMVVIAYRYGLPVAAEVTARRLPISALDTISTQTLAILDRTLFSPTRLGDVRREEITRRFLALSHPNSTIPLRITFRTSAVVGPNAMALPNGTIVVTDPLVTLAGRDEELMAVLAHEAGHVAERHGLRNVIQSSVVSLFVSWYLGDINAIIAAAPTALAQAKYSRDLERAADDYAATMLRQNGMPTTLLADILERMEREHTGRPSSSESSYLSSHPATKERIDRLRDAR